MRGDRKITVGTGAVRRVLTRRTVRTAAAVLMSVLLAAFLAAGGASPASASDAAKAASAAAGALLEGRFGTRDAAGALGCMAGRPGETPGELWYAVALARQTRGEAAADGYYGSLLVSVHSPDGTPSYDLKTALALAARSMPEAAAYIDGTVDSLVPSRELNTSAYLLHLAGAGYGAGGRALEAELTARLLGAQLDDGGWVFSGDRADPDMTAIVLQALAPYVTGAREAPSGCGDVRAAAGRGVAVLSAIQDPDGAYSSFGSKNAESAAQVVIALCALGIDPAADGRFVKGGASVLGALLSFAGPDGSFSHTAGGGYSGSATAQALLALSALTGASSGQPPVFLFDPPDREAAAAAAPVTGAAETAAAPGSAKGPQVWRTVCAAAALAAGAVLCAVLCLVGKRRKGYYVTVAVIAAAAAAAFLFLRIETPDSFGGYVTEKADPVGSVTLTISCAVLAGRTDLRTEIPEGGLILDGAVMKIAAGDTVLTVLNDAAAKYGLLVDRGGSGASAYIRAVDNIGERDYGELSGWMYSVNGESASVGCGSYRLKDGDVIIWEYTLTGVGE